MVNKILIIGDSFSASDDEHSWTKQLKEYQVDNMSMCGSSEYRLIKKIDQINVSQYQRVIFVHTSPNRIYLNSNPYYQHSDTHHNCDLIYSDIYSKLPDFFAKQVVWWFENIFDLEQAKFNHSLLLDYAIKKLPDALHITFFDYDHPGIKNLHHIWKKHPGKINHMSIEGNQDVLEFLSNYNIY